MSAEVIAIANQKGGVGKTMSTINIGIGMARQGKKVLLIDADPQGTMTNNLGFPPMRVPLIGIPEVYWFSETLKELSV